MSSKTLECGRPCGSQSSFSSHLKQKLFQKLDCYLEAKGLKKSETRNLILQNILSMSPHFTIAEVEQCLKEKGQAVGLATLYRTLRLFVEAGILNEIVIDSRELKFYELNCKAHHDHIFCLDCKKIFEFSHPKIEWLQDEITSQMRFIPHGHRHILFAKCQYLKK